MEGRSGATSTDRPAGRPVDGPPEPRAGEPPRAAPRHTLHHYVSPSGTDTTRRLCAAMHLDRRFCDTALGATIRNPYRAVHPSYGVDLALLVRHALLAERRSLRQARLLAPLRVAAVLAPLLVLVLRRPGRALVERDLPRLAADVGLAALVLAAVLALAWVVVLRSAWERYTTLGTLLLRGQDPADLPAETDPDLEARVEALPSAVRTNVIVFSGWDPFVGSGVPVSSSSFSLPLVRSTPVAGEPRPVEAADDVDAVLLLRELSRSFADLGLANLRTDTRLFVGGTDVRRVPELLPDPRRRPRSHVEDAVLAGFVRWHDARVRPYLCVEATAWNGQLVVSTFIRVVRLEGAIFVETSSRVLPPLELTHRLIDMLPIRRAGERRRYVLGWAGRHTLAELSRSRRLARLLRRSRRRTLGWQDVHDDRLKDGVVVDYGAETSLRADASGTDYSEYFMRRDMDMYVKVVQQRIVGTIARVLQERGYDTELVRQVQTNIISTTFVDNRQFGDNYSLSNVGSGNAVGPGASAGSA